MASSEPVLLLAQRLSADARSVSAASLADNAVSASQGRIAELRVTVAELGQVRRSLDALRDLGAVEQNYGSPIEVELGKFESKAAAGLPSPQLINNANRRLQAVLNDCTELLARSWDQWAGHQIDSIPIPKIALLETAERIEVGQHVEQLRSLRRLSKPNSSDISLFKRALVRTLDSLSELPEGDEEVLELVERLSSGGVQLSDLTTDELSTLRSSPEIARQVTLTWGSS